MAEVTESSSGRGLRQDRQAQIALGLAIGLNIFLFILVLLANDRLVAAVPESGSSSGLVDSFGPPSNAFILPIIGLIAWLLGVALGYYYYMVRAETAIAYTVWAAIVLVELATWVPVVALLVNF